MPSSLLLLAAAVLILVAGNLILSGRLAINQGAHAFLMGRPIEDGVMQQVLDARCPRVSYRLCAFRDRLPASADDCLWDPKGLLERTGGWSGSRSESWHLILVAAVTHPLLVAEGALRSSGRQLVCFLAIATLHFGVALAAGVASRRLSDCLRAQPAAAKSRRIGTSSRVTGFTISPRLSRVRAPSRGVAPGGPNTTLDVPSLLPSAKNASATA